MKYFPVLLAIFISYFNGHNAYAQSPSHQKSAPYTSSYIGGMSHITVGKNAKTARMLNQVSPAAGAAQLSNADKDALNDMAAKVWHKYRVLTSGAPMTEQRKHLSITTPKAVQEKVKNKTLKQAKDDTTKRKSKGRIKPAPGVTSLLQKYEERKKARGRIGSVKLND